ncbi:hypothetical protein M885DRAFT_520954 [Pelagophyceae sp. CCMP2097]|nr:hypothetical protein M885DRAFT_520954 [Pelagophyceae sp. CCMP2097]
MAPMEARIGYVTDVEGNVDYFRRYVHQSEVLCFEGDDLAFVSDEDHFVFGGDAVDKGAGDVRLCRLLVKLKRRYPQRVHLLVGNRDLNKLRLSSEVDDVSPASDVPKPHWDDAVPTYHAFLNGREPGRVLRLQWMLQHTLGCPNTFEFRRTELALLRGVAAAEVSDDDVASHFVDDVCGPDGALRQYLENACVAARLGQTLFVHGAVDRLSAGFVPCVDSAFGVGDEADAAFPPCRIFCGDMEVDDWVAGLNALLVAGLAAHASAPTYGVKRGRGGEVLMALQNRCALWGRSVISNSYCDGGNIDSERGAQRRATIWAAPPHAKMFEAKTGYTSDARDATVAAWLAGAGVRRVVVGHKPSGDSPAILRAGLCHAVEIISADTSYSDPKATDNRGRAVTALVLKGPLEDNRAVAQGLLSDGRVFTTHGLASPKDPGAGDQKLGTVDEDGWWVKCIVEGKYLESRGAGHVVEKREVLAAALATSDCHAPVSP